MRGIQGVSVADLRVLGTYPGADVPAADAPVLVPGTAGIAVGIVGLAAATLVSFTAFRPYWLPIWVIAAAVAGCVGAIALAQDRDRRDGAPLPPVVVRIYARLLPCCVAGAVLTLVLWCAGMTQPVPGMWLLLYGCALCHLSTVASRGMITLGALFGALAVISFGASHTHQLAILGIGFGQLHILHGVVTLRSASGTS
jgi:hypothetical protein